MRNFALAVGIMIGFFAGLILMVQAAEQWSPWPMPTPTATHVSDASSTSMPPATPSNMATAATTPTATPTPTLVLERVRVTWYGEAFRGGLLYCGTDIYGHYDPDDRGDGSRRPALRQQTAALLGERVYPGRNQRSVWRGPGHLDLSRAAWDDLGHPSTVGMTIKED